MVGLLLVAHICVMITSGYPPESSIGFQPCVLSAAGSDVMLISIQIARSDAVLFSNYGNVYAPFVNLFKLSHISKLFE